MSAHGGEPLATPGGPGIPVPGSALVIAAHPDDAEFQCGATLASFARQGCEVHHLVLTDGSKGTWDPDCDRIALVERRRDEQREAARRLGAGGEVLFLDRVDGELAADDVTVGEVAAVIRRLRPRVVLSHDHWRRYRLHPDHEVAGRVAVRAVVAARDPFFYPDQLGAGLHTHRPDTLLLFEPDEVNHLQVVSEADLQAKLSALEAHESQLETTHFYRLDEPGSRALALEQFRSRERARLSEVEGAPGGGLVEVFHLLAEQL